MAHLSSPQPARPPAPPGAGTLAPAAGARLAVPLSVWPAIPGPGACPASPGDVPCPRRAAPDAVAALVAAFTAPGDLVAAPDPAISGVVADVALASGRRAAGLAPAARRRRTPPANGRNPGLRRLARLRAGGPAACLHGGCRDAGQAALAITAACPVPGCLQPGALSGGSEDDAGLAAVYAACQRVLRPGGVLAVITTAARAPSWPAMVIAYARAAGLTYAQHVIALHAPIRDGRLHAPAGQPGRAHLPAHTDYLIFTSLGGHCDD